MLCVFFFSLTTLLRCTARALQKMESACVCTDGATLALAATGLVLVAPTLRAVAERGARVLLPLLPQPMRVLLQVSWLLGAVAQAQVVDAGARLRAALCAAPRRTQPPPPRSVDLAATGEMRRPQMSAWS